MQEKQSQSTIRLLDVASRLEQVLDREMKTAGLPAFIWFRIMRELRDEGDGGLRPVALQQRVHLAQYNLSRIIDRMEHAGLVIRFPAMADQRGHILKLSPRGQETLIGVEQIYHIALERYLGDRLNARESGQLLTLLEKF